MEGDNSNNHINIIVIIKLLSHDDNSSSLGTCFRSDFRGFESRFGVLSWELSELRCTRQYSSISVFLPHFRRTGKRGASFLPLHKFSVWLLDPAVSMSYLGDPPRHAAGAEVQLAREAAVAVVARVGEGGAQLNTVQIIRVIRCSILSVKHF